MNKDSENWDSVWDKKEFGGIARAYTQIIENKLLNKWKPKKGTILEAGCGLGRTLLCISDQKNIKLVGVDYSPIAIKKAKKLFEKEGIKAKFLLGDIRKLPFKDFSIDLVFNQGVIEHFSKPEEPLKEMLRVSKKRIIVIVPNALSWDGLISIMLKGLSKIGLYDYKTKFPYDWKIFFTKKRLCDLLERLNCKIVHASIIGVIPILPIPAKIVPSWIIKMFIKLEKLKLPKREIFVVADKIK